MDKQLLEYFNGDTLAASVWLGKYAFEGEITPDDMHKRLAKRFATETDYERVSELSDYGKNRDVLSFQKVYNLFKNFENVVPQGSIMSILGSDKIGSLSNCFILGHPEGDSYGGIMQMDEQLVQLAKRRGGIGLDISTLRPNGTKVTNAAGSSTGAVSFMERYSNSCREVAQNGRK